MVIKLTILFFAASAVFPLIGQEKKFYWFIPQDICAIIADYASSSSIKKTIYNPPSPKTVKSGQLKWLNTHMCNNELIQYRGWQEYNQPHFQYKLFSVQDFYEVGRADNYWYSNMVVSREPNLNNLCDSDEFERETIDTKSSIKYFQLRCYQRVLHNEFVQCMALAQKKLVALHTIKREYGSSEWMPKLRIFSFVHRTHKEQENGLHALKLTPLSYGNTGFNPSFKKIEWIYGGALLALPAGASAHNLVIVPIGDNAPIVFAGLLQKLPLRMNTFAVHQPRKNHEIIIADAHDNLYFAALNDRTKENKIKYRKIWNNEEKFKIDQLWFLNDLIYLMNPARECQVIPFGDKNSYKPQQIHQKLMPIYKIASAKKQAVCNQNGFLFDDYEPLNF